MEERRPRVFENRMLMRICGTKKDKVDGEEGNYIMGKVMICTPHPILFG